MIEKREFPQALRDGFFWGCDVVQFDYALELACAFGNRMRGAGFLVDGCGARVGRVSFTDWVQGFEAVEWALDFLGWGSSFFGVEYAGDEELGCLEYLNAGDTYDSTIGRVGDGEFFVTSWGDWYESAERAHCESEGVIRCGYCSAFTPLVDGVDWSDTRCESCGRNVSTGVPMAERAAGDDGDGDTLD